MRSIFPLALLLVVLYAGGCSNGTGEGGDPPDLAEYIAKVRSAGLSENAESSVGMVARFVCGQSGFKLHKDESSGIYWVGMHSFTCPRPGLTEEELAAFNERNEIERAAIVDLLRPIADADQSGFVSSDEGWILRTVYEFGMKAGYVVSVEGSDPAFVSRGCNVSIEELQPRIEEYNRLAEAMSEVGIEGVESVSWSAGDGL